MKNEVVELMFELYLEKVDIIVQDIVNEKGKIDDNHSKNMKKDLK